MKNVLFVCMGNVCRSPMAQVVACNMAVQAGRSRELLFDSAGTHASHVGERPDPRAEAELMKRGYKIGRIRSRKISQLDFEKFDLILAMDCRNLAELQRLSLPQHLQKLRLLMEFADGIDELEVPDPYYGSREGFERALDLCEASVKGLIKKWR